MPRIGYKLSEEESLNIKKMFERGHSGLEISRETGIHSYTIYKEIKRLGLQNKHRKFTEEDIIWLTENFPHNTTEFCANYLGKPKNCVRVKAKKLGLPRFKWEYFKYNIDPKRFFNIVEPEIAYFLGLLWADGTVRSGKNKVALNMVKQDIDSLNLQERIGKMTYQIIDHGDKHPTWKVGAKLSIKNKPLYDFLCENDYKEKSYYSPCKILSEIPDNLKKYFFLGWSDGDGHWSKFGRVFAMAGNKLQSWKALENFCNENDIQYKIEFGKNKRGEGSIFKLNADGAEKFGAIIYSDFLIGLERKRQAYESQKLIERRLCLRKNN